MASGTIPKHLTAADFKTFETSVDNVSISANSGKYEQFSLAKTGYRCIGVVGVTFANASSSGANYGKVALNSIDFWENASGGQAGINCLNTGSSAAKVKIKAIGLYVPA